MGFGGATKRVAKVAFWFVKPGFPGLDKFNNPLMDAADLAEKMHEVKQHNDDSKKIMQEAIATVDSGELDDKACYQLWVDALEIKHETLDESVKRRLVVACVLMLFTLYLVGWGIGVYRGLYDSFIFFFGPKPTGVLILIYSIPMLLQSLRYFYRVWCIYNRCLPSFARWLFHYRMGMRRFD